MSESAMRAEIPEILSTERLQLRRWRVTDAQAMCDVIVRNRDEFRQWFAWADESQDPIETAELLATTEAKFECGEQLSYAIRLRDGEEVIGNVALYAIDEPKMYAFGYWLDCGAVGNGYVTEAVAELARTGFAALDIETLRIRADRNNVRSLAIAKRLGFTFVREVPSESPGAPALSGTDEIWHLERGDQPGVYSSVGAVGISG
jgi:ribosomal-protein-serine acetyltransferase